MEGKHEPQYVDREQARALMRASLTRWRDTDSTSGPSDPYLEASLRHAEVFALASIALELHEIALTLQARHEEALRRGERR